MVLINTSRGIYHVMSDSLNHKYGTITEECLSQDGDCYIFFPSPQYGLYDAEAATIKDALKRAGLNKNEIKGAFVIRAQAKISLENWGK